MRIEKGSKLVMIGDSITDCGRNYDSQPSGWGSFGEGYVSLVNACLTGITPENRTMVINKGINGNTIRDLKNRWEKDVLSLKPDYVSIMIGINDVWRQFDGVLQQLDFVSEEEFEKTYQELITKTKPQVKDIFIMSPFMIESNPEDRMLQKVKAYGEIAKKTAEKNGLLYIDVQEAVDEFLKSLSSYILSNDRVHPGLPGHMIIAKAFLDGIGFDWK